MRSADGSEGDGITPDPGSGLDPESAASVGDLAALLRRLHLEAGKPSLRELSRHDPGTRADGHSHVRLTRSTMSAALNGERLPSQDTLSALLAVLGVPDAAQKRWLAARGRLEPRRATMSKSSQLDAALNGPLPPSGPAPAVPPARLAGTGPVPARTSRRRTLRWLAAVLVAGSVTAALLALRERDDRQAGTSIGCDPPDCLANRPVLMLTGRLDRRWPADQQPHVLIRVQSTQRWYLGPAITITSPDRTWRQEINIGNPDPQPKDRHFTVCIYTLPTADLDRLAQRQLRNDGDGLTVGDLPLQRTELACTAAVRLANG